MFTINDNDCKVDAETKRKRVEIKMQCEKRKTAVKKLKAKDNGNIQSKSKHRKITVNVVNTLIMDTGASTIKIGRSSNEEPKIYSNCIMKAKAEKKRFFIGDQVEECRDLSGLYFILSHERGYISRYDIQKTVWDYTFSKFPIEDAPLIMTQPIFNFKNIQDYMDEICFEEYDVQSLYRANATDLAYYNYVHTQNDSSCCLVVDSGYSFTHIIPYINGMKYTSGIIRTNIGGKLLTNYLKDIISYRQFHVMEETYVINQVKEDVCFMSLDFKKDMHRAKTTNEIVKNYVLPDFHNVRRGYIHTPGTESEFAENCQVLKLNNERILVPEIIMRPSIIPGMDEAGLAQCIVKSIFNCPVEYQKALANNIVVFGGNSRFPGFKNRLTADIRMFLPSEYNLSVYLPDNPVNYAWQGGKTLSGDPDLKQFFVTKQEYDEFGSKATYEKFNKYWPKDKVEESKKSPTIISYLDHVKDLDFFNKNQSISDNDENNLEFIIEGEDIESLDGKLVTLEFDLTNQETSELSKQSEASTNTPKEDNDVILIENGNAEVSTKVVENVKHKLVSKPARPDVNIEEKIQSQEVIYEEIVTEEPTIISKPVPKVFKTFYRIGEKPKNNATQIVTYSSQLGGNINYILPTSLHNRVHIAPNHILNGAVLIPQNNIINKNLTVQLIPISNSLIKSNTNIFIRRP